MNKRAEKFKKKLSGDNRKRLYDAQKERMIKQEAKHTKELVKREEQIKRLVQGELFIHLPYYIIFAKEIYSKQNKFKDLALLNEIIILERKWESRGLNPIILEQIKNLYVQAYANIRPFRLDVSLLDGVHVLS